MDSTPATDSTPAAELSSLMTLGGEITLDEAMLDDRNMLNRLVYRQKHIDFLEYLVEHRSEIEAIVSCSLGLKGSEKCRLSYPKFWITGSFNFIDLANAPIYTRLKEYIRRGVLSLLGYPVPSRYIRHRSPFTLKPGYLIIDYIEETEGTMLSDSWEAVRGDKRRRINLFQSLARIMLSLGRIPLSRIGSFTIDDAGVLSLTNRPLTVRLQQLENEGIPTYHIDRNLTYTTSEPYVLDLVALHDNRLVEQPNSIYDEVDCREQMTALNCVRSILPRFVNRDLRHGPFPFTLTDFHASNIFVNGDGCIRRVIDLEWACTKPMELYHPPYWMTGRGIDMLEGEHLDAFDTLREEFMDVFEAEERLLQPSDEQKVLRSHTMRAGWDNRGFFFFHALESPRGFLNIFRQHIQPLFAPSHVTSTTPNEYISPYWTINADEFVARKMKDKENYEAQLPAMFQASMGKPSKDEV
ncbi:MAG: hypothetical protein Q9163_003039 [Psora crenata]